MFRVWVAGLSEFRSPISPIHILLKGRETRQGAKDSDFRYELLGMARVRVRG